MLSRYRGFTSFDAMFSIIPVVLMLLFVMDLTSHFVHDAAEKTHKQQVFNKLVSIADYTVKKGAVRKAGDVKYPNWLDENSIDKHYADDLRYRAGLSHLLISIQKPQKDLSTCVYRLVVVGEDRKIARLFVCGE